MEKKSFSVSSNKAFIKDVSFVAARLNDICLIMTQEKDSPLWISLCEWAVHRGGLPVWEFLPGTVDKPAWTDIFVIIVAAPSDSGIVNRVVVFYFFADGLYSILPWKWKLVCVHVSVQFKETN